MLKEMPAAVDPGKGAPAPPRGTALMLRGERAADLMSRQPVQLPECASIRDAAAILTDRKIGALAVVDDRARPVGVVSRTDLVRFLRDAPGVAGAAGPTASNHPECAWHPEWTSGPTIGNVDKTSVRALMTPLFICVTPDTPAAEVVRRMTGCHVHQLFVVDSGGALVGVITASDLVNRISV